MNAFMHPTRSITVIDSQRRRLHDHVVQLGFTSLHGYLAARCQHAGLAELAQELDTTTAAIRGLLAQADLTPPPQP